MSSFLVRAQQASWRPLNWPINDDRSPGSTAGCRFDLWRVNTDAVCHEEGVERASGILQTGSNPLLACKTGNENNSGFFSDFRPSGTQPWCALAWQAIYLNATLRTQTRSAILAPKSWNPSPTWTWAVCLFWFLTQLPFLSSAFRIDEPYYLWVAEHISRFPLDPYGGLINWLGSPRSVFETLPNPPLIPYCLALWLKFFSASEISVHLFALAFSLLALHGFGLIARSSKVDGVCALLLLLCSPGFCLGSQVAMLDIPMLALLLMTVGYSLEYNDTGKPAALMIALASSFLCPLAKYGGVLLVPLVLCLAIGSKRRTFTLLIAFAPLLSICAWNLFCWHLYGEFHLVAVRRFQMNHGGELPLLSTVGILARFGLGVFPLALMVPLLRLFVLRRLPVMNLLILPAIWWLGHNAGLEWLPSLILAISIAVSLHALLAISILGYAGFRTKDLTDILLTTWGTAAFLLQLAMPYTAVRYLVPVAPPIILLILRHSNRSRPTVPFLAGCAINFLLVLSLAIGDAAIGNGYREVVQEEVIPRLKGTAVRFFFSGHWGFQYYAQLAGGQVIDKRQEPQYRDDDLIVIPTTAVPDIGSPTLGPGLMAVTSVLSHTPEWPVRTVDAATAANFHASWTHGTRIPTLLPFGISTGPSDTFRVYCVSRTERQGSEP